MRRCSILLACALACSAYAEPYALIVCGSGGDDEFSERFRDWGNRLYGTLTQDLGFATANVTLLLEGGPDEAAAPTLEGIQNAVTGLATSITPEDDLFVFLIGHGSHLQGISKINVPGPDVAAENFSEWLGTLTPRRTAIVNAASASAGFINVLSAENRIICTATKSVEEKNATVFMDHFISALEDGSADLNRDTRISIHEACEQAAALTRAWYESEGLISTEHALIDDNGDGRGSRLAEVPDPTAEPDENLDGDLAQRTYLRDFAFPDSVPQDLINTYLTNLAAVDELKAQKESVDPTEYANKLEEHLINAARANAQIRDITAQTPPTS